MKHIVKVALHPEGVDRNMGVSGGRAGRVRVALHPEGVDRNFLSLYLYMAESYVALHPEGVDRNHALRAAFLPTFFGVALHPEGVDRNAEALHVLHLLCPSPSTRRAWIEIFLLPAQVSATRPSPSTRRAWIEIK